MNLRNANHADLEEIMAIETVTFAGDAWSRKVMESELRSRAAHYIVTEADGGIVGYAGVRIAGQDADVQTIGIAEAYRGQGRGRAMMQELISWASDQGSLQMFLEVRADNPKAIALYESLGFEQIDTRHGYYQPDGVDAIVMMKEPV